MRTRSTDGRRYTTLTGLVTTSNGLPVSPPYNKELISILTKTVGDYKEVQDEVHPNFRKRKAAGELVMGPFALTRSSRSMTEGRISGFIVPWNETHTEYGDLISRVEDLTGGLLYSSEESDLPKMGQISLIKAYAKMNGSDLMVGETLSDLDKSVSMLRRPFSASVKLLDQMVRAKRRNLKKTASNLAKAASDAWLEYRYGWQPIILDCQTIIKNAHDIRAKTNRRLVARASETRHVNPHASFTDLSSGNYHYTGAISEAISAVASSGVVFDVASQTTVESLNQMLGSRPRDMASLVWEKIPYSFVVDWFVNVGDWVEAITPNPAVTVLATWTTTKYSSTVQLSANCVRTVVSGYNVTGSCGSSTRTELRVGRTINPPLPTHPVVLNRTISTLHSVDAMSLAVRPIIKALSNFMSSR